MNDKNLMTPEERAMAKILEETAGQMNVSQSFKTGLENKLMNAHQPKSGLGLFSLKKIISTAGWAIGWALLILMFIWVARTIAPQPQPAAANTSFPSGETATPESLTPETTLPEGEAFSWNGTTLYLNAPLPETPAEAKIYITKDEVFATQDDVNTLAQRFGMNGEIYQMTGETGNITDYLVVDGNQQLRVRSDRYFTYFPDYAGKISTGVYNDNPNAEALIHEFMQPHGFNFEYRIEHSQLYSAYLALPLTPDGFASRHEHFNFSGIRFYFNKDSIEYVDASLLKYDEIAALGIISSQEAFERLLDPAAGNAVGVLMGISSGASSEESWRRIFPLDQTITYFGYMNSTGKSVTGGAPLVTLDGYTVTGNIQGVTENMQNIFVEATGRLHEADSFKTFEVQSWKVYDGYDEGYIGTIQREGEQAVINTLEGIKLILPDMPSDVQLPLENAYIMGVTQGDTFEWKSFDTRIAQSGGGGGGLGFYKLNLTGTPVPLPPPASMENSIPQPPFDQPRVDGLRGTLTVTIHKKVDGSQVTEYGLFGKDQSGQVYSATLTGTNLLELDKYHGLPITLWGTVGTEGAQTIHLEKYEIPFPDLQFQIAKGRQELTEVDGQSVIVFTIENGASYIQLSPLGEPDSSIIGIEGDLIEQEVLIIPDETFGNMPALRTYSGSIIQEGSPELTVTANEPYTYDDSETGAPRDYVPPNVTVEKVELVYYMPNPRYVTTELEADQRYLQPAWLFRGHYSNGDEFEYLIQALKDEFLLPELAPYTAPG